MASYNNDLRLKEIATGDETDVWGTSTNDTLELIGDAFGAGTVQFSADANQTFTIPDGAANAIRSMYVNVTSVGSLTATRTLTLAPNTVSKVWIIKNSTTGGRDIIVAQGSGGNVTIANGATKIVASDGAGAGGAVIDAFPITPATQTQSKAFAFSLIFGL